MNFFADKLGPLPPTKHGAYGVKSQGSAPAASPQPGRPGAQQQQPQSASQQPAPTQESDKKKKGWF